MKILLTNALLFAALLLGSLASSYLNILTLPTLFLIIAVVPGYTVYQFLTSNSAIDKTIKQFNADPTSLQVTVYVSSTGRASNDFARNWLPGRIESYSVLNGNFKFPRNYISVKNNKSFRLVCDWENGYLLIHRYLADEWTAYKLNS